ncbi:MAG: hypothetical protein K8T20_12265 [Planctomycetes bacterium]|nr:hypothetical protein [Planctomycetota bacterium]
MACCSKCETGARCEKPGVISAPALSTLRPGLRGGRRPPLVYRSRPGYLPLGSKVSIRSAIINAGAITVSSAIPMPAEVNSVTADTLLIALTAGAIFTVAIDGSNDTETWSLNLTGVRFTALGLRSLTLNDIAFRFIRLRHFTNVAATASFAAGVWRWRN